MGSAASKAARIASNSTAARRYPTTPKDLPHTQPTPSDVSHIRESSIPGPTVHPPPSTSDGRDAAINFDSMDPDFRSMLHTVGVVDSASAMSIRTLVHSAPNPAHYILSQRAELSSSHDEEARNPQLRDERRWVDTGVIRRIVALRDELGWEEGRIERELGLKEGVVGRLGRRIGAP
ncbi:hypothetical protein L211DRAFT_869869 [Terfezia boudieri ATCC MYA-4762]|uniref:Helix-turn-helix domain-containing protein n=1 Tax=Terfezia boudieri ATCC MYA-4762 TaxID=1051890 RepID=A0A3N4LUC9_9PEZI|nr:hypothetical protein L211DRAFT_869869 [Terfezia boudieri ATCC MYA-4762]